MERATTLIFNPVSRSGRGARIAQRAGEALRRLGVPIALRPTSSRGEATRVAEELARSGAGRVFACGGDGTLSEVADGLLRAGGRAELGALPGGTGNSFLRHFGLHEMRDAIARVARGEPRAIDAALVTWGGGARHIVNAFGVGFMARVGAAADQKFKPLGAAAYTAAVFPEIRRLRAPPARLVLDGRVIEDRIVMAAVCNTSHTGGAMWMAPEARVDDGLLDVVALREVSRAQLLALFPRIFSGRHIRHPRVIHERARVVELALSEPSSLLGDGEVFGETPARVEVRPRALKLLA